MCYEINTIQKMTLGTVFGNLSPVLSLHKKTCISMKFFFKNHASHRLNNDTKYNKEQILLQILMLKEKFITKLKFYQTVLMTHKFLNMRILTVGIVRHKKKKKIL